MRVYIFEMVLDYDGQVGPKVAVAGHYSVGSAIEIALQKIDAFSSYYKTTKDELVHKPEWADANEELDYWFIRNPSLRSERLGITLINVL